MSSPSLVTGWEYLIFLGGAVAAILYGVGAAIYNNRKR
jgi:hypothetical protein